MECMLIKRNTMIFLLSTLLVGCGAKGTKDAAPVTEFSSFASQVDEFQESAHNNGRPDLVIDNLIIKYGDIADPNVVAECQHGGGINPTITVDTDQWKLLSSSQKRAVLFHELGHCVLERNHLNAAYDNETVPMFVPTSYMLHNIGQTSSSILISDRNRLDNELFNPAQ